MKLSARFLALSVLAFFCQAEAYSNEAIGLNNEGVKALNKKDWQLALEVSSAG